MADVVSPEVRSRMMAGIRSVDTKPELVLRKALHCAGFRYRLNSRQLPGRPDLVFPRFGAVLFVHGCFWHQHDCHLFKWPKTRQDFWKTKIEGNRERDARVERELIEAGWRIAVVWECAMKGKTRLSLAESVSRIASWLSSDDVTLEIQGR